jgi:hypothetical protein
MNIVLNAITIVLLFTISGFSYTFATLKHWSIIVRVIFTTVGFSVAVAILSYVYILTGFPTWMRWLVDFFFV